jgi:hypothetical protein
MRIRTGEKGEYALWALFDVEAIARVYVPNRSGGWDDSTGHKAGALRRSS